MEFDFQYVLMAGTALDADADLGGRDVRVCGYRQIQ